MAKLRTLKIAATVPWNTIKPGLQHTLIGDLVSGNQFESLVGSNALGMPIPLSAKSWTISEDQKIFRFDIDTTRTFQDGSPLTAMDFKKSWERALSIEPISANKSLLDVAYLIEGFEAFPETGSLSGLIALSDEMLEIRFSQPFRMALEHLQGTRFAAVKLTFDGEYGTGKYQIAELAQNHALLTPRKELSGSLNPIEMIYVELPTTLEGLLEGSIDAIIYLPGTSINPEALSNPLISTLEGQETLHAGIGINTTSDSIFADARLRKALKFLMIRAAREKQFSLSKNPHFTIEPQLYLPFQRGRLTEQEAADIINAGERYVEQLVAATSRNPIKALFSEGTRDLLDLLKKFGIRLSADSDVIDNKKQVALSYAKAGPDLMVMAFSVANGDPDGIYHKLGKNGAIRTPWVNSDSLAALLEEGRSLPASSLLDTHYKKVNREFLQEVPLVHLGFVKALTVYRNDRIKVDPATIRKNEGHLDFLRGI